MEKELALTSFVTGKEGTDKPPSSDNCISGQEVEGVVFYITFFFTYHILYVLEKC